ncbi:MAG: hypothetical protein ACEY3D_04540 [Rickettsia sp.]|uniref:hypothetical protein n=1 Tax=Rickettsia sp. TaxID=789 RepID=UPI00397BE83B
MLLRFLAHILILNLSCERSLFYKSCGTHVLSIRSAPRLVNSLLFLKLTFVYYFSFHISILTIL